MSEIVKEGTQENRFGIKLRSLRKERKMTLKELGNKAGVSYAYISMIEKGQTAPSYETFNNIVSALKIAPEILLNEADEKLREKIEKKNQERTSFAYRLKELRTRRKFSVSDLARMVGLHDKTDIITSYEQGTEYPEEEIIGKLADVLRTTKEWLMGEGMNLQEEKETDKKEETSERVFPDIDIDALRNLDEGRKIEETKEDFLETKVEQNKVDNKLNEEDVEVEKKIGENKEENHEEMQDVENSVSLKEQIDITNRKTQVELVSKMLVHFVQERDFDLITATTELLRLLDERK